MARRLLYSVAPPTVGEVLNATTQLGNMDMNVEPSNSPSSGLAGAGEPSCGIPEAAVQMEWGNKEIYVPQELNMEEIRTEDVGPGHLMASGPVVHQRKRRNDSVSPAQVLAPRVLRFSGSKSNLLKLKNGKSREAKDKRTKELGKYGPLQKLPGIKRNKERGAMATSPSRALALNVMDRSTMGRMDGEFAEQWQEVFSEAFGDGDASPLLLSCFGELLVERILEIQIDKEMNADSLELVKNPMVREALGWGEGVALGHLLQMGGMVVKAKEGKYGNRWQVLADEEAGGGEPSTTKGKMGLASKSPGIGRFSANPNRGAAPLGAWGEKGTRPTSSSRPGKENNHDATRGAGPKSSVDVSREELVTKFEQPEGRFDPGIVSLSVKSPAARELIMSTIGLSPPSSQSRERRMATVTGSARQGPFIYCKEQEVEDVDREELSREMTWRGPVATWSTEMEDECPEDTARGDACTSEIQIARGEEDFFSRIVADQRLVPVQHTGLSMQATKEWGSSNNTSWTKSLSNRFA
ncbi:hypothetical protein MA16_Dca002937 [Dendrobium catenatum]|uniref:Uncharacterized protein n=1 Tax=Dendrobium catenatum TaxID=906689 RepID=A0A2I0X953_9ASPA|nr:hypothetical protein MA16_Dca002937 [Dendrobium catenatum]